MKTNIEEAIEQYLDIFPQEKDKLESLVNLIKINENNYNNLFNRKNFIGHITASGFIYAKNDKKLLLLEHKALKKFLQPGGHVELVDNDIIDAAKREILEETGLKSLELVNISVNKNVPFDINTHFIPENEKKKEKEHYHHDFRFLFAVDNAKDISIDLTESNNYKWIDINDLKNNDSFRDIINKILNLLNNDYKVKQYYSKIIEEFNINLKEYNSIVISHIIPDCKEYLEAINYVCPILKLIPKPKSIDEITYNSVKDKYDMLHIKREEVLHNTELLNCIKKSNKNIIVFDIGGYFADFVQNNVVESKKIEYIIEDTENGYQKYEKVKTNIPILSVARSVLKDNEDNLVGESVIFSADAVLRSIGKILEYEECGIIGYGKIGEAIGNNLIQKGVKPTVYDFNSIKQIRAFNRMCNIDTKESIIQKCNVLFLATGNHSLNINDFRNIKNGTYIFSVTSSDDEIDNSTLDKEYNIEEVAPHVFKYSNECNYFYLIQKGNAVNFIHNAVMANFIHLVRSEMIVSAQFLKDNKINYGENQKILELDNLSKQLIGKVWLEVFKKGSF